MKTEYIVLLVFGILTLVFGMCFCGVYINCKVSYNREKNEKHTPNILDNDIEFIYARKEQENLLKLMKKMDRVFGLLGMTYWVTAGTLIGLERHGGFIPWDDDIDCGIMNDQVPYLVECEKNGTLAKYGLRLHTVELLKSLGLGTLYQIYDLNTFPPDQDIPDLGKSGNFIDLFSYEKQDTNFVPLVKDLRDPGYIENNLPDDHFETSNLYPLKRAQFHNIEVWKPNNPYPYLDRLYPKWNEYVATTLSHSVGTVCNFLKLKSNNNMEITPDMREKFKQITKLLNV